MAKRSDIYHAHAVLLLEFLQGVIAVCIRLYVLLKYIATKRQKNVRKTSPEIVMAVSSFKRLCVCPHGGAIRYTVRTSALWTTRPISNGSVMSHLSSRIALECHFVLFSTEAEVLASASVTTFPLKKTNRFFLFCF